MRKFSVSVFTFVALFATDAVAQATYTLDADGDGYGTNVSGAPTLDAATRPAGYAESADDCDDANAQVHPGAKELLDDDVDNDCDGDQAVSPAAGVLRAFGCSPSNSAAVSRLIKEIARCTAATALCTVNMTAGKFNTSAGSYFLDENCDGVREVIDQASKDRLDELARRGAGCKTAPARRGHRGSGKGKGKGTKSAPPAPDPKVTEIDGKVTTLATDVVAVTGRVGAVETLLIKVDDAMTGVKTTLGDHETRIGALEKGAEETDTELTTIRQQNADTETIARSAETNADLAVGRSSVALSSGVSAGLTVGYLVKAGRGVSFNGETLRGSSSGSIMFQGQVGAELPWGMVEAVGGVGVKLHEQSPDGGGLLFKGGGELLFKLGNPVSALGLGVGYLGDLSGGKVSGASAESRGGYGEFIYQFSPGDGDGATRFNALRVSLGAGYESLGTRGRNVTGEFNADGQAPYVMAYFGTGGGVGANRR